MGSPTAARAAATLSVAAVLAASCASLAPPVAVETTSRPAQDDRRPLRISAVEGRPDGLVLQLESTLEADTGRLQLRRKIADGPSEVIQTISVSQKFKRRLHGEGLTFIDRSVVAGAAHRYQLVYLPPRAEKAKHSSKLLTLTWREPPPPPTGVKAGVPTREAVELSWRPDRQGAMVFRRNVLEEGAPTRRLADLDPGSRGRYVDRDVEPGGVYTYRVALARRNDGFTQYGPPSEPLYVSVPQSP